MTLTKGMTELLDRCGLELITNHSMTTDEILEFFGFTVEDDGEIVLHDRLCPGDILYTGMYYDEIEYN